MITRGQRWALLWLCAALIIVGTMATMWVMTAYPDVQACPVGVHGCEWSQDGTGYEFSVE